MKFPWDKYEELPLSKRNTAQIFITRKCNLKCKECFAKHFMMKDAEAYMSLSEYMNHVDHAIEKGAEQINILGGEPMLHHKLDSFITYNIQKEIKTTIYTNGTLLHKWGKEHIRNATLRVSLQNVQGNKGILSMPVYFGVGQKESIPFDANFMVSAKTTLREMLNVASICEIGYKCKVFFISSIRECNHNNDFFSDTENTMPILEYKQLVHNFLTEYKGDMEIHISKRGVFESTISLPHAKCKFTNILLGGQIVQCPYDLVNERYQDDYVFDQRPCQQNNTCLMSKIKVKRK
jgi:organic radical activating enzyme